MNLRIPPAASPCLGAAALLALLGGMISPVCAAEAPKPVLLYSRYFNAAGENRYLPAGTYKDVLTRLREHFDVRADARPLTRENLIGVNVVLIANPSDRAVGTNPAPPHVSTADIRALASFVESGGGLMIMGNQENHNLETVDLNRLLGQFGMQFTNLYTDAKKLNLPGTTPLIGGLRWAYYTGNLVTIAPDHHARPRPLVSNDLNQKPVKGRRDQAGALLAVAEPGRGRVVVITDSGWITNDALSEKGIGDVAIHGQDNFEIFRRIAAWAAGQR